MFVFRRPWASLLAFSIVALQTSPVMAMPLSRAAIAYQLKLPNGETAIVFNGGVAQVFSKNHRNVETQILQPVPRYDEDGMRGVALPDRGHAMAELSIGPQHPYAASEVIVAYRDGIAGTRDLVTVDKPALRAMREGVAHHALGAVPSYTNDFTLNRLLGSIGVDRSEHLFRHFNQSALEALNSNTMRFGQRRLNFANAYLLHVSAASVPQAVALLGKYPAVAYVSPNWTVAPMHAAPIPLRERELAGARQRESAMKYRPAERGQRLLPAVLPTNYTLTSSGQSMLNAPSMDAAAAFDEIDTKFHQLPGQGETVTNVSLGDLDDSSAASNSSDPCNFYASAYGPTTIVQGGQRYLDMPSMPLIPTFTTDVNGNISGTGEVCGVDPFLDEIGLDFSVMAPLPHNLQRGGEQGAGDTDLLGVAPGANFRLVVPTVATIVNIDAALLAAALQSPRPDVITASIGFGEDQYGFPSRYLEEDPLSEAIVASIVGNYHIPVCIASGDGVRTFTTVAIGPSGGSAPTEVVKPGGTPTVLNDDFLSTIPSVVFDSGSVDVGGTTLDDIFANPPQYAHAPQVIAQHAYAETRWTGFTSFSSGFGSRVNVAAPSDNILSLEHVFGGGPDSVSVVLNGGTSASAPLTAASIAVFLQVARLTGQPFSDPLAVRSFLASTGTPVPPVSQADTNLNIGPQVDVRAGVETLLGKKGIGTPNVARVAVEQRRDFGDLNGAFTSDTDPTNIDLANGARPGADELSWITIAPDWEYIPNRAQYTLYVTGHPRNVIASTPWARVLPVAILQAAGMPLVSSSTRTVNLTYSAGTGFKSLANINFSLTFGPAPALRNFALAPQVASTTTGNTIAVSYDVSTVGNLNNPKLVVSEPGRVDSATGQLFHPAYSVPVTADHGTIDVPVSALQGGGIYGVGIELDSVNGIYSNFAFTRVAPTSSHRPSAPLLSYNGSTPGHNLTIPYGGSFQVSYDVSSVPNADGAKLEISAAGPGAWGIYNPFNNPNGTIQDKNGLDVGSVYYAPVMGTSGMVTIDGSTVGLYPTLNHVVRVIPTRGGTAIGEGGDVSTVSMNGVFALDGGFVNNGWGINANGSDGFITSGQTLASGEIITSLENFSQTNNAIIQNIAAGSSSLYFTEGWGVYGSDIGLFGDENTSTFASTFNLLNTVASGTIGAAWTPSYPSTFFVDEGAANQSTDNAAFYGFDQSVNHYKLFTSNLTADTFSTLYDIQGPVAGFTLPQYWGIGENTATNTAVLPADDFVNANNPPEIVLVNLATGTPTTFTGLGSGFPYGIGVDSVTNKAAVPTLFDGGLSIYNLATQTGFEVQLPPSPTQPLNGLYTIADQKAGQFLVEQTTAPNFGTNNNSLSRVLTYDESGNLLGAVERFDLFGTFLPVQSNNLQVNPTTRTAYLIGPGQQQLAPFQY